jgi:hypothetical protein
MQHPGLLAGSGSYCYTRVLDRITDVVKAAASTVA